MPSTETDGTLTAADREAERIAAASLASRASLTVHASCSDCGMVVAERSGRDALAQPHTTLTLFRQALFAHKKERGCAAGA